MLLMVGKGIREEYIILLTYMKNLIKSTWKMMIKIKNRHIFNIGM